MSTKTRVTVTLDKTLVSKLQADVEAGRWDSASAAVNEALATLQASEVRRSELRSLLDDWDDELGPMSAEEIAEATAELDRSTARTQRNVA